MINFHYLKVFQKQKNSLIILFFLIFPILFSFALFSLYYANITHKELTDSFHMSHPNIYIYRNSGDHFLTEEIHFINQYKSKKITPIYFNKSESIDISTNDYTISTYQISNKDNIIFDKTIQPSRYSQSIYSAVTYHQNNKPNPSDIIKAFANDDGIYISQSFLQNANIDIQQINKDTLIEFSVHVPIFSGTINNDIIYPELTSFVYPIKVKKKISGIIQRNPDLEKITDTQNIIIYPLEDCYGLIKQSKDIPISADITKTYTLTDAYPTAYLYSSSHTNIQDDYIHLKNDSMHFFNNKNINNHFQIQSQYFDNQVLFENISNIHSILINLMLIILIIYGIVFIILTVKTLSRIKTKSYIGSLIQQNLSETEIIKYLKWESHFLMSSFILISLFSLILVHLVVQMIIPHIRTSFFPIIIIEICSYIYIYLLLFIRYKKQKSYIRKSSQNKTITLQKR